MGGLFLRTPWGERKSDREGANGYVKDAECCVDVGRGFIFSGGVKLLQPLLALILA